MDLMRGAMMSNNSIASILFVDDDREMVDSFSRWFRRNGYKATPTYHAMHGLMAAANDRYDVAVVDIGMPDMTGLELLAEFVELQFFPIIVLSGHKEPELKSEAKRLGAANYLLKPVWMDQLESAIRNILFDRELYVPFPPPILNANRTTGSTANGQI
jgi:DNA-binding NtrC family response regulator